MFPFFTDYSVVYVAFAVVYAVTVYRTWLKRNCLRWY